MGYELSSSPGITAVVTSKFVYEFEEQMVNYCENRPKTTKLYNMQNNDGEGGQ